MSCTVARAYPAQTAAGPDLATLFVSLELSKSKWLATVLSLGGDKMSRHVVAAGDWDALLGLLLRAKAKAEARLGRHCQLRPAVCHGPQFRDRRGLECGQKIAAYGAGTKEDR